MKEAATLIMVLRKIKNLDDIVAKKNIEINLENNQMHEQSQFKKEEGINKKRGSV